MTDMIHIEPAHEKRPAFAAWGLTQTSPLQTASSTGWDVPIDLYPFVPVELLAGAYVDGYPFSLTQAQPVISDWPKQDDPRRTGEGELTVPPAIVNPPRNALAAERKPRKRATKKPVGAYTHKPTTSERADREAVQTALVAEAGDTGSE